MAKKNAWQQCLIANFGAHVGMCKTSIQPLNHYFPVHQFRTPSKSGLMVTHKVFSVVEIECPPLKSPMNGTISNENNVVESIILFTCLNGFEVTEHPVLLCLESGYWNGTEPICTGVYICRACMCVC